MKLYRVAYYHVIARHIVATPDGQEHHQRTGVEKVAYVVAESESAAALHISTYNDEVTGVTIDKPEVQVASVQPEPVPAPAGE